MRYLFFSCIAICCLSLMSCGHYTFADKLLAIRANTHYWEGVLGKDTIRIKDIIADNSFLRSGVMVISDSSYAFDVYKYVDVVFEKNNYSFRYNFSYNFDKCDIYIPNIKEFSSLSPLLKSDEAKALLNSPKADNDPFYEGLVLLQKPYNPNYKPSRYEKKILKKLYPRL